MKRKMLMSVLALAMLTSLGIQLAFADFNAAHILRGEFDQGADSLTYWYDSSVDTYGLESHLEHAMANWDNLSSNVGLNEQIQSNADIKVYVGSQNLPIGVLGATDYWVYNWLGQVDQVTAAEA